MYIRQLTPAQLHAALVPFLAEPLGLDEQTLLADRRLAELAPLIQERIKLLPEAVALVDWAFKSADDISYPEPKQLIGKKLTAAQSAAVLAHGAALLATVEPFSAHAIEEQFRGAAEAAGIAVGSYFAPFRVAITGKTISPPLFESFAVLGREETVRRIANAQRALTALVAAG
jgi:glutamyl-tRNA synthetase